MNKIIALVLKFSGAGPVWDAIDGYKTKIAGVGLMLSGGAMMFSGAAAIVHALSACPGLDCIVGLVRGLGSNPDAKTIGEGFLVFQGGLATLGIGHKVEKLGRAETPATPPSPPPATPL